MNRDGSDVDFLNQLFLRAEILAEDLGSTTKARIIRDMNRPTHEQTCPAAACIRSRRFLLRVSQAERGDVIRIISARFAMRMERGIYEDD
jgi:uncharacterized DUF497 family protein